ncbi:MAG: helix-turn-helix domain-containing protein [Clostridia bacterium]|nr:helix-turn-helix domain-containing protein [Clostridia bacterium]
MDSIADKIQNLRKTKGLTQEQFAERAGVSRQTVYKWESGYVQPNSGNIAKLCEVFEVDKNYFYDTVNSAGTTKQSKKPIIIFAVIAVLTLLFAAVTLCIGLITYQPEGSAMRASTSSLTAAHFYISLAVTIVLFCLAVIFAVKLALKSKK